MPIDNNRAAGLTSGEPINEVSVKRKAKKLKPGPDTLLPGEPTERVTTNLPQPIFKALQKRVRGIGDDATLAGYIRNLIERDLKAS